MASALRWIPDTLYNYSLAAVVASYNAYQKETRSFHENMLFDIYYQLYKESRLKKLGEEFSNLDIFKKLLRIKDKRCLLHNCFQAIMDHGCPISSELAEAYVSLCTRTCNSVKKDVVQLGLSKTCCPISSGLLEAFESLHPKNFNSAKHDVVQLGLSLGNFLIEAGWFPESEIVFSACLLLCHSFNTNSKWSLILQCYTKLLYIRNSYCKFKEAKITFLQATQCTRKIQELNLDVNFATTFGEFSAFYFSFNLYDEAYRWANEALKELNSSLPPKDIVMVLCQACRACTVKRKFEHAEMLIKQALLLARDKFGSRTLVFARTLVDYGYYLYNTDAIGHALKVYQTALSLHVCVFGGNNLLVAKCHEDLAYTSYCYGYDTGSFKDAEDHIEKALTIMLLLFHEENFLLASVKKVKALILEEIALDSHDIVLQEKLFAEAQELHTYSLHFAIRVFGQWNLYTAKCYGNLGRLFQSMKKYKEAQNMQLEAIQIKEDIIGPNDYEVGISVSHLASLYTYDMNLHKEAESLFLRSLDINKKNFGEAYSGLEYDYRGLLRVYSMLGNRDKVLKYRSILHHWKVLRDDVAQSESEFSPLNTPLANIEAIAPEDILSQFGSIE